jgi:RNA polymerase sigma factor (sigma-70 family)
MQRGCGLDCARQIYGDLHMQEVQRSTDEISSMLVLANRMARRYGRIGMNEPEDIAQNAMLKLLNRSDDWPPTAGWLFKTVRSAAIDAGRIHSRDRRHILDLNYLNDEAHVTQSVCERADQDGYVHMRGTYIPARDERDPEMVLRLNKMLQQLTKPLRDVLVLYAEGLSYEEIAAITKAKIGTVRSRLYYARKYAQEMLAGLN